MAAIIEASGRALLVELDIANFAIIERLHVALGQGLNVLTGETGAGKSIVIDAVSALLGSKVGADLVRSDAEQARVEGVFACEASGADPNLLSLLGEQGLAIEDGAIILSRDIYRSGRSVARINGRAVPASILQQIGQYLVDIHGQSEHLSLLRSAYQLDLLDSFGDTLEARGQLAVRISELRRVRRELTKLSADERELARRADLLRFQVNEIEAARLQQGEEEELAQERILLANAERLAAGADAAYRALYGGDDELPAAADRLGDAAAQLADLAKLDPALRATAEGLDSAVYQVEEAARTVRAYRDRVEFNPERLQEVEERLELLHGLKRKYGNSIGEILAYGRQSASELDSLVHGEERREELLALEASEVRAAGHLAAQLADRRREAAVALAAAVSGELGDLNMRNARYEVSLERTPDPEGVPLEDGAAGATRYACDTTGIDRVTFLISPNPGEPLKPLAKIASGGEMARLLLALKAVLSRADNIGTLIFDEVDVGVGGRSGRVVGEKLCSLTPRHQVICVTHLPQVACFADAHFRIVKQVGEGRTATSLERLSDDEQVAELATMLAGVEASETARLSAGELLRNAVQWKERYRAPTTSTGA